MQLSRLPHYLKKIAQLGPRTSFRVVRQRLQSALHERQVRRSALNGTAAHTWEIIAELHLLQYGAANKDFTSLWRQQTKKEFWFLDELYSDQSDDQVIAQANRFEQKIFDVLGSGPVQFSSIPWHSDFRLYAQDQSSNHLFDKYAFYKDIHVQPGMTHELVKDIKVPWELSRFQHLFVLGRAYQLTRDERYAAAFVDQVNDWMHENPYLLGVNWVCPMDVGIRALNWVCAFHFFKDAPTISELFWKKFFCSLYDHYVYLENNWEMYDGRTSNHYLSDLVGYLYLCYFFEDFSGVHEKMLWCRQEIINEFHKQVFDDGTDYEGSTSYHVLVTELFFHATLVARQAGMPFDDTFDEKLKRMFDFIAWSDGIQIGDNDSGKILYYGITPAIVKKMRSQEDVLNSPLRIKKFPFFGVSFFKSATWEVSLRHHVYNKVQPSGHFHNDVGSITVAIHGIPVIVDPGSYVYTPSAQWRNYFRSVQQHNTFFLAGREPVVLDERLFALDIPEQHDGESRIMTMTHGLYAGMYANREVVCRGDELIITDWWEGSFGEFCETQWNFVVAPGVDVIQGESEVVMLLGQRTLHVTSDLEFKMCDGWFSGGYGSKISCKKLQATYKVGVGKKIMTKFKISG